jgi:hypothetical protein
MRPGRLDARKVATAKKPGHYGDGGGLYLQVSEYGSRNWVFRYTSPTRARANGRGKVCEMGLGSLDTFSLAKARDRARQCRELVAEGVDPIEQRRKQRDEARAGTAERTLFRDAARSFLALHKDTWKNQKHKAQWESSLKSCAYPRLGARPVAEIDGALITEALLPIWTAKAETAQRVKQRIERIIQWVKDGKPLPQRGASKRVRHHPAMTFAELPAFMADLRARDSIFQHGRLSSPS